eukprot:TRINITY_DN13286_c0_g1_i1.p1 TRINITY_DN13286_c0_g1~~TRINITY_DN13286_c0_g1_i1.p1  ORF type:complete len:197 (+),score=40.02 TRINITY_DN13286_c0_g1_i1:48-638(+)
MWRRATLLYGIRVTSQTRSPLRTAGSSTALVSGASLQDPAIPESSVADHVQSTDAKTYRFGFPDFFVEQFGPQVRQILSLATARAEEAKKVEQNRAMWRYQKHGLDTSSPAVQVARITVKMNRLAEHCLRFPKDAPSRIEFRRFVARRRRLLLHIRKTDFPLYWNLVEDFALHNALAPRTPFVARHAHLYTKGGGL